MNIFGRLDDNGYFEKDGAIYKMEYPLKEGNVKNQARENSRAYGVTCSRFRWHGGQSRRFR